VPFRDVSKETGKGDLLGEAPSSGEGSVITATRACSEVTKMPGMDESCPLPNAIVLCSLAKIGVGFFE
jgi:hypothetical protein